MAGRKLGVAIIGLYGLLDVLEEEGIGCIGFSPLAQGPLSAKYSDGIPSDSRAGKPHGFLRPEHVTEAKLTRVRQLNALAQARRQTLAQMALAWVLRHPGTTSALVGASRASQVEENVAALDNLQFSAQELQAIEEIQTSSGCPGEEQAESAEKAARAWFRGSA